MTKQMAIIWGIALAAALPVCGAVLNLEDLDISSMSSGWGKPLKNQSVTGKPLSINGEKFQRGVGTHAPSEFWLKLDGHVRMFRAKVGVDDAATSGKASIEFVLEGDGKELWRSGICRRGEAARECKANLAGITNLVLIVTDAGDGRDSDHANWVEAVFEYDQKPPVAGPPEAEPEEFEILTPPAPPSPRINGPRITGLRPGSPFIFRIPCTGQRPMRFAAENLPAGLRLDENSGIITGAVEKAGTYPVILIARNSHGEARRELRIVVGDRLALTPPMGWNSWYIHYHRVSDKVMREAADQMIASGMADYGYQYVNIDDCWMVKVNPKDQAAEGPVRDESGRLRGNKRFPDMKGLADYIHSKGLRAGLYTSPGPTTCAGYAGSWEHEALDAQTFAEWGFDFLKYDWCSYGRKAGGNTIEHLKKPYQLMWNELQKQKRDIVFNLCQYGMGEVWKWGAEVGHCWRTTGDLGLERGGMLPGFYNIGFSNGRHHEYARPGAWNDPDYILIGWVGDAHRQGEGHKTSLTPNEQYSYMSMWCLMAAPLIFSGDMAKLDPFTLNVLCNHEVIDIDQDPLGKQAKIVRRDRREMLMVKELEDGSKAIGLFNLSPTPLKLTAKWDEAGVAGRQRVRDLWRQKDLGIFDNEFSTVIPRHGVALLRLFKQN